MIVNISYTEVTYSVYRPNDENPEIAYKCFDALNIYEGRVSKSRIAREIPVGATVENVRKIELNYEVDAESAIAWLNENGKLKE